MQYTKIPEKAFEQLQMNAGILVDSFDPGKGEIGAIMGATSGGVNFKATPTFIDKGEDLDNCPKNTMELKGIDYWTVNMSGSFKTVTADLVKRLLATTKTGGEDATKIVPANELSAENFKDVWWVGDYSNKNTGVNAGFIAIHMMNTLSAGGLQIQSADKAKGTFSFSFDAHYSIEDIDNVPFEIYVKAGE